jgi:hypothetical protein
VPPRKRRKVSPQTLIGEAGISIIARRVNEMGYLYHDRRVDHGIDGESSSSLPTVMRSTSSSWCRARLATGATVPRLPKASSGRRIRWTWTTGSAATRR